MKKFFLLSILVAGVQFCVAQQKDPAGTWHFMSVNSVGLIEGEAGSAFQLQTVNGAAFKSWFGGVGVGIDYYRYRTIPLFADFRKEFGKGSQKVFVYADLGINFSWLTDQQKSPYVQNDHWGNGFYNDFGLGYKLALKKNNGILLSLGYSYKKVTETFQSYYVLMGTMDFIGQPGNYPTQKIDYGLNRLSIKLGWQF